MAKKRKSMKNKGTRSVSPENQNLSNPKSQEPIELDTSTSSDNEALEAEGLLGKKEGVYTWVDRATRWFFFIAGLVFIIFMHYHYYLFTQDDAYISLRYSRNLYEYGELVWNHPSIYPDYDLMTAEQRERVLNRERVEGMTNFLWTLIGSIGVAIEENWSPQESTWGEFKDTNEMLLHYNNIYQDRLESYNQQEQRLEAGFNVAPEEEVDYPYKWEGFGPWWSNFPMRFLKMLSLFSLIGIYIIAYLFSARVVKLEPKALRVIPGLLIATGASLNLWSASGLEVAFFILWCMLSFYWLMRALKDGPKYYFVLSSIALIFAQATRPEALLFFAAAGLVIGIRFLYNYLLPKGAKKSQVEKDNFKYYLIFAGIFIVFLVVYYWWKVDYFGNMFPNPARVKSQGGIWAIQQGFSYIVDLLIYNGVIVLVFAMVLGIIFYITDKTFPDYFIYLVFIVVGYFAYMIKIGGDILPLYRLFNPGYVFLCLFVGGMLDRLIHHTHIFKKDFILPKKHRIFYEGVVLIYFLVTLLLVAYKSEQCIRGQLGFTGVENALTNCHREVVNWFRNHADPNSIIVGQDMGVIPYESMNMVHVDTIGLCDKTIARKLYEYSYSPYLATRFSSDTEYVESLESMKDTLTQYLISRHPEYLLIHVSYDPNISESEKRDAEKLAQLAKEFPTPEIIEEMQTMIRDKIYYAGFYYHYTRQDNFFINHKLRQVFDYNGTYFICLYEKVH